MKTLALRWREDPFAWQTAAVAVFALALGAATVHPLTRVIAIAASCVFVLVVLWSYSPQVALLSYVAVRPLVDAFVYAQIGGLTLGQVWGAGFLMLALAYLLFGEEQSRGPQTPGIPVPFMPLAILAGYALLTWTRPGFDEAFIVWLRLGSWLILAIVIERITMTLKGQERVLRAMLVFAVALVAVIVYVSWLGLYGTAYYTRTSAQEAFISSGQGPHNFAQNAVLILPFVLLLVLAGWRSLWGLLLAGILAICVVFSFVRSDYLALGVVLLGFVWLSLRHRSARLRFATFSMILAALAVGYSQRSLVTDRFVDLAAALTGSGGQTAIVGTGGRNLFWTAIVEHALSGPGPLLVGGGVRTSYEVISAATGAYLWSHNDFLEFLATGGLLLLLLYVGLVVWLFKSTLLLQRDPRQSHLVRGFGWIATCTVIAFVTVSITNATALSASGCIPFAALIGLVRGMAATPGNTVLDALAQRRLLRGLPPRDEPGSPVATREDGVKHGG